MRKTIKGINDFQTWCEHNGKFGELLKSQWVGEDERGNKLQLDEVSKASNKRVKWKCSKGHEWVQSVAVRVTQVHGCPYCSGHRVSDMNSLAVWCNNNGNYGKQLINEWVGEDNHGNKVLIDKVSHGSHLRVKWKCSEGHEWFALILNRTNSKSCCPYCSLQNRKKKIIEGRLTVGVNDLKTWCENHGEYGKSLIDRWIGLDEHGEKVSMDNIAYSSHRKVQWKNKDGHISCSTISDKTRTKLYINYNKRKEENKNENS